MFSIYIFRTGEEMGLVNIFPTIVNKIEERLETESHSVEIVKLCQIRTRTIRDHVNTRKTSERYPFL